MLWYGPYLVAVYIAYEHLNVKNIDIKMSIATVLGFAVALLLGFRTSAGYDRWWEARKIWGGIVNDSRSLVRQLSSYYQGKNKEEDVARMANYQIAWCYALKNSLRRLDPLDSLENYLSPEEIERISKVSNKHNEILKLMNEHLAEMREKDLIDGFQLITIDNTLRQLCDHMGKSERIKSTVFPTQYRSYIHRGIIIFTIMLPYGMLFSTGPLVILICLIVSFFFFMLENIAFSLQDPFENRDSDIPMTALCRTIEINLLQMIGSDQVPDPVKPDDRGVLM